jgi:hypothetical protein
MSTKAQTVLDQFKALSPDEQREVSNSIFPQRPIISPPFRPRRRISDIAGKYHARPNTDAKNHDRGFAESIA